MGSTATSTNCTGIYGTCRMYSYIHVRITMLHNESTYDRLKGKGKGNSTSPLALLRSHPCTEGANHNSSVSQHYRIYRILQAHDGDRAGNYIRILPTYPLTHLHTDLHAHPLARALIRQDFGDGWQASAHSGSFSRSALRRRRRRGRTVSSMRIHVPYVCK